MKNILKQLETATLLEDLHTSIEVINDTTDDWGACSLPDDCYEYHSEMIANINEILHNRGELK